jgi:hypothetical protein
MTMPHGAGTLTRIRARERRLALKRLCWIDAAFDLNPDSGVVGLSP